MAKYASTVLLMYILVLQNKWSHMIDIVSLLTSIRSLLADPNPESPANPEAARLFVNNRQ